MVVVHLDVDQTQEVLELRLSHLVVFVLVGFPQAAEDPTVTLVM